MIGAIIGDVIGSRFEWNNLLSKEFELFTPDCRCTDDSILSIAVAKALLESKLDFSQFKLRKKNKPAPKEQEDQKGEEE